MVSDNWHNLTTNVWKIPSYSYWTIESLGCTLSKKVRVLIECHDSGWRKILQWNAPGSTVVGNLGRSAKSQVERLVNSSMFLYLTSYSQCYFQLVFSINCWGMVFPMSKASHVFWLAPFGEPEVLHWWPTWWFYLWPCFSGNKKFISKRKW